MILKESKTITIEPTLTGLQGTGGNNEKENGGEIDLNNTQE